MNNIEKIFDTYTSQFINDKSKLTGYIDKYFHSYFVRDEALSIDKIFTRYNDDFKSLLEIESLFHDIGRFKQLELTGNFVDEHLKKTCSGIADHGDLGSLIMKDYNLLTSLFPKERIFDEEIIKVIQLHSKNNLDLAPYIKGEYIKRFKNYGLKELLESEEAKEEKMALTSINTAIIQDADRLDIFRKIVKGIWMPESCSDEIKKEVWDLFKKGQLPSMSGLRKMGLWNPNVGHLVRMNFVNQMLLVPELQKIKAENLIEKVYMMSGSELVRPAYDFAKERINTLINESEDKILVKRR